MLAQKGVQKIRDSLAEYERQRERLEADTAAAQTELERALLTLREAEAERKAHLPSWGAAQSLRRAQAHRRR